MTLTLDRRRGRPENPARLSGAERRYRSQLRKIGGQVGMLVDGFPAGDPASASFIEEMLRRYADALAPWAEVTAAQMIADVNRRDEQSWMRRAADMSNALRDEIRGAPTGDLMRALMAEQVTLIKSIPLEAAQRVHRLALDRMADGGRAAEISRMIQASGEVAKSRADLIARTEVSRAASNLTEARALHVGSPGYVWRTSEDSDVRADHRILEGRFIPWDQPPIADRRTGRRAHAGCIYGCRCWQDVVLPRG
ncbi:phage head morphogenesis protein [Burkholderia sp. Ac-20384]|uniref:phage head morphogenesis protein n=1 Tax=Burkholderia sp. Ac-20384 TaxID=2703902 RepID=UPI00197F5210|nr:phage minor head protein [Burkholderia sp. Ac-20384]MBN3822341.1 phage head morphogenesis protein [Burkholderia sp. Ac-20384]